MKTDLGRVMPADLVFVLARISENDPSYEKGYLKTRWSSGESEAYAYRNALIYQALAFATRLGINVGFTIDTNEPDWPVAFIDLPFVGQLSWHMVGYQREYDGHTTPEKYKRIESYGQLVMGDDWWSEK